MDGWMDGWLGGDGLDLEVHGDERKDHALEVLDQVVEATQTLGVPGGNTHKQSVRVGHAHNN